MHIEGGFSKAYNEQGVEKFYTKEGSNYSNPHRYDIERLLRKKLSQKNQWISANSKILDLACGSGEITTPLLSYGYKNIRGTDPYTFEAFKKQTKLECDSFSFMDILNDCYEGEKFDCIICSYAMHLVKETLLHDFCNKLSELSKSLIIIAPHKLPVMKETYGWKEDHSFVLDKIHFRAFSSYNFEEGDEKMKEEKKEENEVKEVKEENEEH